MEVIGTELVIDINYLNLVGSMKLPRLTVELNLQASNIAKVIQSCDLSRIGEKDQKYRLILEEVKEVEKDDYSWNYADQKE